jgi:hypothetical protein
LLIFVLAKINLLLVLFYFLLKFPSSSSCSPEPLGLDANKIANTI